VVLTIYQTPPMDDAINGALRDYVARKKSTMQDA
jgi:trimethylamine:corrinoid methyltransferase-like protein